MKIKKVADDVTCKSCGCEITDITIDDIEDFSRLEVDGVFLADRHLYAYKGIICPCCGSEIFFTKTRKKLR